MTETNLTQEQLNGLPAEARDPLPPLREPRYKITIERIEERHTVERPWVELRSDAEQAALRTGFAAAHPDMSFQQYEREAPAQRGYRPRVEVKTVTTEILKSEVEELDIRQVIAAVHGLPAPEPRTGGIFTSGGSAGSGGSQSRT